MLSPLWIGPKVLVVVNDSADKVSTIREAKKKKKEWTLRSYIPEHDNIRFNSVWAGESPQLGSEELFSLYSAATSISLNLFHIVTSIVRFSIISVDVRK